MSSYTVEDLDRAIAIVAYGMDYHQMREALPVLKRLQAEKERLLTEGDALAYARRVLEQYAKTINASANDNMPVLIEAAKAA
jgi:hypothetical protein